MQTANKVSQQQLTGASGSYITACAPTTDCSFTIEGDEQRPDEDVVMTALSNTNDDKLGSLALRIVLTGQVGIPTQDGADLLTEAETVFAPKKPRAVKPKKATAKKTATKKTATKKAAPKKAAARKR